ncbi:hypothetical protein Syun_018840 [Stephania yunnanensis]|uniref:Uncharacterized protein n=1 Tax=Stephania yunnanensis TaxID=152371 RepID=A0AAP0NW63_9MAGN
MNSWTPSIHPVPVYPTTRWLSHSNELVDEGSNHTLNKSSFIPPQISHKDMMNRSLICVTKMVIEMVVLGMQDRLLGAVQVLGLGGGPDRSSKKKSKLILICFYTRVFKTDRFCIYFSGQDMYMVKVTLYYSSVEGNEGDYGFSIGFVSDVEFWRLK